MNRKQTTEDRRRQWQNVAAFVAVAVLLLIGFWLIDRLSAYSRNMACIESRHRVCR